jgi:hypothetical protein
MTPSSKGALQWGGDKTKKAVAASLFVALVALLSLGPTASAQTAPAGTIEAFIGTDLVNVQGYPPNTEVSIQVVRNDIVIGSVAGTTDVEGFVEFNHAGGGQVSEGGDCFEPPATPDVLPGDTIRTVHQEGLNEVVNSAVVRDVGVNFDQISTNVRAGTITVSGHARSLPDADLTPGADVLELRLNKGSADLWDTGPGLDQDRPGRRDLRVDIGENVRANGTWTRTLNVGTQDARDWQNAPGEVGLEWSVGAGADEEAAPPAIFVADEAGGEAIVGCPPLAQYGITGSNPRAVNKAFGDGNRSLVLSGVSFNASAVSVTLDDRNNAATPAIVRDITPNQASGAQNWSATFTNAEVAALRDGRLSARAAYTVVGNNVQGAEITRTFNGANLNILKDTVAPTRAPTASPGPGVYNRALSVRLSAQAGTTIHYTVDGRRPTANSREFVQPIRVTGTQTIKAVAIDRAGNASPVGSFRYRIR